MNMGDGPDENGQDIFVHEYRGKLVLEIDDDEEDEISAGYIKCYQIHLHNIGSQVFDVLDPVSDALSKVALIIEQLDSWRCPSNDDEEILHKLATHGLDRANFVNEVCGDLGLEGNVNYVDEMYVDERFRGVGLGLFMLDAVTSTLAGQMGLTLITPFPLQFLNQPFRFDPNDGSMRALPPDRAEFEQAKEKLSEHYGLLGFRSIGFPDRFMMLGHWNGLAHPRIKEVCPHLYDYKYGRSPNPRGLPMVDVAPPAPPAVRSRRKAKSSPADQEDGAAAAVAPAPAVSSRSRSKTASAEAAAAAVVEANAKKKAKR